MLRDENLPTCPHCGQLLASVRLGVRVGAVRARVYDVVKSAGSLGIDADALFERIFQPRGVTRNAMYQQIHLLNELIADTGWRIEAGRGLGAIYRLRQKRRRLAA